MSLRTRTPPPAVPLDPAWYAAFPLYYASMSLYGLSLALRYAPSFVLVTGPDYAQGFGVALCAVSAALVAACWLLSVRRQNTKVEAYLTSLLLTLLLAHVCFILVASGLHPFPGEAGGPNPSTPRDSTPPQTYSVFTPVTLGVFPAVRLLVAFRSGNLRKRGWW